ncbi:MAG: 5-(carboxyamino)imidazole ribonucleotide mutase [Chloroflexi bacterium]|nr:5-(carboxyamino)imidazole ribonucleotide mutase [Chloroflexota bacterium]
MQQESKPLVGVVMGSESDRPVMQETASILDQMGIPHETYVISAHRTPDKAREYGVHARERGLELLIAGAGGAAHLPGVLASWTTLPVIGVPLATSDLKGVDALYAIVQMPAGVPVATVAVGLAGAKNAAYLAAEILGLKHEAIRRRYEAYRTALRGKG